MLMIVSAPFWCRGQLVVTVAGVLEVAGQRDGQAFEALFNNPHGIAVDSSGNVYVADRFGHYIRQIRPDGEVVTIAGTGETGRADGPALEASFNEPWGICTTAGGVLYVADTRNNLIRKIENGEVSTVAGSGNYGTSDGPGQAATFGNPTGIEIDSEGNLYIADHLTHIIRKIEPSGWVRTIAGRAYTPGDADGTGSTARFFRPYGLTLDNEGDILVADEWNHLIRRVTPEGVTTTIAGTGEIGDEDGLGIQASFNYPWDITVDDEGLIYVADGYNNVVRRIDDETGTVSTYVGTAGVTGGVDGSGPDASFSGATALAYWPLANEIYVGDAYNHLVRKIINVEDQRLGLQLLRPSDGILCEGENLSLRAVPATHDNYEFWIDGQLAQQGSSPDFSSDELGIGDHLLQVRTRNGSDEIRSSELRVTVIPAPRPEISILGDTIFFEGDSVTLIASLAEAYLWNTGDTTALITVFESGIFQVEVRDQQGCFGTSREVVVTTQQEAEAPAISFLSGSELLCPGEEAVLQSNYSEYYQWFHDGWPIPGATGSPLAVDTVGIYQLQVSDSTGAVAFSAELNIDRQPPQIEDFTAEQRTAYVDDAAIQFRSQTVGVASYRWDFGDGESSTLQDPQHVYTATGRYRVMLRTEDEAGCRDTLVKDAYVEILARGANPSIPSPGAADSAQVYLPTAFTPNGDGVNDVFIIRGENITEANLAICNQWGELVFESEDPSVGWVGDFRGQAAQASTYTYVVRVTLGDGRKVTRSGHITLIR